MPSGTTTTDHGMASFKHHGVDLSTFSEGFINILDSRGKIDVCYLQIPCNVLRLDNGKNFLVSTLGPVGTVVTRKAFKFSWAEGGFLVSRVFNRLTERLPS